MGGPGRQEGAGRPAAPPLLCRPHWDEAVSGLSSVCSLLNANKINCLRVNTFQDLQSLSLLSVASVAKELGGSIKVTGYARYDKGEGLEKREEDFAAEIAKMVNG